MSYAIYFDERAVADIKHAKDYYASIEVGLDQTFFKDVEKCIGLLEKNPFFQIRYASVRCLPLHKFPFMIHFTINENAKEIQIRAIIHTQMSPDKWIK